MLIRVINQPIEWLISGMSSSTSFHSCWSPTRKSVLKQSARVWIFDSNGDFVYSFFPFFLLAECSVVQETHFICFPLDWTSHWFFQDVGQYEWATAVLFSLTTLQTIWKTNLNTIFVILHVALFMFILFSGKDSLGPLIKHQYIWSTNWISDFIDLNSLLFPKLRFM